VISRRTDLRETWYTHCTWYQSHPCAFAKLSGVYWKRYRGSSVGSPKMGIFAFYDPDSRKQRLSVKKFFLLAANYLIFVSNILKLKRLKSFNFGTGT